MSYELPQPISSRINRAQDAETGRMAAIADELDRLCRIYETEHGNSKRDGTCCCYETRCAETWARKHSCWLPITSISQLGIPGASGNENDTYVSDDYVDKVNNLLNNNGSIIALLRRLVIHNNLFPDTSYAFHAFTGFEGRSVYPILRQRRIAKAMPASQVQIDTFMAALGFQKGNKIGEYWNDEYCVWDLLSRNVLVDTEGDLYVVDAEIKTVATA